MAHSLKLTFHDAVTGYPACGARALAEGYESPPDRRGFRVRLGMGATARNLVNAAAGSTPQAVDHAANSATSTRRLPTSQL